nr:PPA1309 family protein [Aestuariimicrobium ganziense]
MSEQDHSVPDALVAALADIERHVSRSGWDQPARLFALVRTDELIRNEPSLAEHLSVGAPDGLSSVEQEDFHAGERLDQTLAGIAWPASVAGCAIAFEHATVPPEYEHELPQDPHEASLFVARHPHRVDIRLVAGALRDGSQYGLGRVVSNPDDLVGGPEFVPALTKALWETLR